MPTLAFVPEFAEKLKQRYPEALADVYDRLQATLPRPGQQRRCVFDFQDGLRLVVSRERIRPRDVVLHVSASAEVGSAVVKECAGKPHAFRHLALNRFYELSGDLGTMSFVGRSHTGVMHWYQIEGH